MNNSLSIISATTGIDCTSSIVPTYEVCELTCLDGFTLLGNNNILCQNNLKYEHSIWGSWNGTLGTCERSKFFIFLYFIVQ